MLLELVRQNALQIANMQQQVGDTQLQLGKLCGVVNSIQEHFAGCSNEILIRDVEVRVNDLGKSLISLSTTMRLFMAAVSLLTSGLITFLVARFT
jgi:hypothetical protein